MTQELIKEINTLLQKDCNLNYLKLEDNQEFTTLLLKLISAIKFFKDSSQFNENDLKLLILKFFVAETILDNLTNNNFLKEEYYSYFLQYLHSSLINLANNLIINSMSSKLQAVDISIKDIISLNVFNKLDDLNTLNNLFNFKLNSLRKYELNFLIPYFKLFDLKLI